MDWEVLYYQSERGESPIEEFLLSLSIKARAKCLSYIDQLEQFGNRLPSNIATKVEEDLWELRPEFGGVEHRLFYFTFVDRQIVVVHAIKKKRQKLKASDIKVAQARIAEVRRREAQREEQSDELQITPAIRPRTNREEP
jgi:phage-related protein